MTEQILTITRTVGADTTVVTMASPVSGEGSISVADFGLEVTLGPGYVTGSLDGDIVMAAAAALFLYKPAQVRVKLWMLP
jgi:hypothetical protein